MFDRWKSDIDLLKASRDGSTQAFGIVVSRYQSLVCAITYGATGDSGRSEELAQDAFLRAWKGLGQLEDLGKFRAWLCSIARNTVQNWFRSQGRDVVVRAASLDAAFETASHESGPEEVVMFEEQQAVIRQALAQMPEGLREPLILFYREGKSTREVAQQLGLSENAARQRISRGRSLLREQVADMIETTITRTKPGKAFTAAVVAAVAGLGIKGTATAVAAAGSYGVASVLSGLAAKVTAVAVGVVVVAGGIVAYTQLNDARKPAGPSSVQVAQQGQAQTSTPVSPATGTSTAAEESATAPGALVAASPTETQARAESSFATRDRQSGVAAELAKPFEFQPQGVLSGRITDIQTGEPVIGARLTISMRHVYAATTDANGFYCLEEVDEAGDYSIALISEEYLGLSQEGGNPMVHLSPETRIVRHLQLRKACMVDVWVVDANGVGIPDAMAVGTLLADDRMREVNPSIYSRKTDPNGYLLLGGFPPAETDYVITAWHAVVTGVEERDGRQHARSECDYVPSRTTVRLTDPNVVPQVRIVLERGEPVQVRVEYADGVPAADAEIEVTPAWWHTNYGLPGHKADEAGLLTLQHVASGLYDVSFRTPTSDSGFMSRKIMQTHLPPADRGPLVVKLADRSPQSLASISGSLVFHGEKMPDSVRITMMSPSGAQIFTEVKRKPNGRLEDTFIIERLEPGTYNLTFSGDNIEETTVNDVVAPSSDVRINLAYVAKPTLAGNVVDAQTGEPIRRFRIRVKKLRSLRGPSYIQSNRWVDFENDRGDFSADLVGPGVYQVQAAAEGYAPTWSEPLSTDEPAKAVLALSAGGAILGRVVNEKGEPLSGATVVPLSLAAGNMPETESSFISREGAVQTADGSFTLPHVPAGTETIQVIHPDYAPRIVEGISVAAGRTTQGVEVVLSVGGTIEGHVYDLQGKPQAGQVLYVRDTAIDEGLGHDEAGRRGQAVTDANGFYHIEHLPEQLCYLQRINKGQGLGVVCRMIVPRDGQVVRADLGGVPVVRGRVAIDGVPWTQGKLLIGPIRSPHSGAFTCYTMTDEQGGFTFGGAMPGVYGIYRQQSAERGQWLSLGTVTVTDADTDVGVLPAGASNVLVTLNGVGAAEGWSIESVFLTKEQRLWSTPAGIAEAPSAPEGPYVIKGVEPGTYFLSVRRQDHVIWQKQVTLEAGRSQWELSFDLPAWNASASGHIRGGSRAFVAWRQEKDVFAIVQPGSDGSCRLRRLPAGRYLIGDISSALYDLPPLAEMELREGEEKSLDLDLGATSAGQTGFLLVQAVNELGWVCDDARIRLEGPVGVIEPVYSDRIGRGFFTTPGPHTLHVEAVGYRSLSTKVNVRPFDPGISRPQSLVICLEHK